jgi:hypothetical protein
MFSSQAQGQGCDNKQQKLFLLMKLLLFGQFQINFKVYIIKPQDFQFEIISHFVFSMCENMIKYAPKKSQFCEN